MSLRTCENCGKQFDGIANARYCSVECRKIGADRKRKDWEKRTDYDRKNRAKVNAYRQRKSAAALQIESDQTDHQPVSVSDPSQIERKPAQIKRSGPLGRMIEAQQNGDMEGYLSALRDYELSLDPSGNSGTMVNGISVNHPCFVEYALSEIMETGRIILSKE
ncbi:MAG: hypothetical protein E7194_00055 [Erysipelotrichaceae bacterium]|nr:hypothetical protein [Erysipelotrichaceae bacterium]